MQPWLHFYSQLLKKTTTLFSCKVNPFNKVCNIGFDNKQIGFMFNKI